jgi:hypothetical protein
VEKSHGLIAWDGTLVENHYFRETVVNFTDTDIGLSNRYFVEFPFSKPFYVGILFPSCNPQF